MHQYKINDTISILVIGVVALGAIYLIARAAQMRDYLDTSGVEQATQGNFDQFNGAATDTSPTIY